MKILEEKEMKKMKNATIPIFYTILFTLLISVSCSAADFQNVNLNDGHLHQIIALKRGLNRNSPHWCGSNTLVVYAGESYSSGGVIYIDVANKIKMWATKNPSITQESCGDNGSTVFYQKLRPDEKVEWRPDGMWAYDVRTGKDWALGPVSAESHTPASPVKKIFARFARNREQLASLSKINLSGWEILKFPQNDHTIEFNKWSSDGSYLVLLTSENNRKKWFLEFYNAEGNLFNTVPFANKAPYEIKAIKDGVYFFEKDGQLRRLNHKTGRIELLPFKTSVAEENPFHFDVSSKGAIVFKNKKRLLLSKITGSNAEIICKDDCYAPAFSSDGHYVAFNKIDKDGKDILIVMGQF
jgi:hypothetical protein